MVMVCGALVTAWLRVTVCSQTCCACLNRLGAACMDPDPKKRPTFVEVRRQLEQLRAKIGAPDSYAEAQHRALSC